MGQVVSDIVRRMKDLENGGWWPKFGSVGRWNLTVTWSDWQIEFGIEFSHDHGSPTFPGSGARWFTLHLGRLGLTWGKDNPE